jgi:hypothetical protein
MQTFNGSPAGAVSAKMTILPIFSIEGGSSLFRVGDFKYRTSFAIKLRDAKDPLSQYLKDQFSLVTQQLLGEFDGSSLLSYGFADSERKRCREHNPTVTLW